MLVRLAKANCRIIASGNQIAGFIAGRDVDLQFRMGGKKLRQSGRKERAGQKRMHAHTQPPAHRCRRATHIAHGVINVPQQWRHALVEPPALVGQRHHPRIALEQADSNALLQPRHRTADARLRQTQRSRRANKIAGLHHGGEHADPAQHTSVEGHAL